MLTEHFHNTQKDTGHYSNDLRYVLSLQNTIAAFEEIKTWEGYAKTPLHSLDSMASDIGVKNIYYKDESSRFGLGSFKALGGTYGVLKFIHHALKKEIGDEVSMKDIHAGKYSEQISKYTVTTATDGNHGRSVAFGAKLFGCKCQIYIHSEVSSGRQKRWKILRQRLIASLETMMNHFKSVLKMLARIIGMSFQILLMRVTQNILDISWPGITSWQKKSLAKLKIVLSPLMYFYKAVSVHSLEQYVDISGKNFLATILNLLWLNPNMLPASSEALKIIK